MKTMWCFWLSPQSQTTISPQLQQCMASANAAVQSQLQTFAGYAEAKLLGRVAIDAGFGAAGGLVELFVRGQWPAREEVECRGRPAGGVVSMSHLSSTRSYFRRSPFYSLSFDMVTAVLIIFVFSGVKAMRVESDE
jgi:hypothetical protein